MSRALSSNFVGNAFAQESPDVEICLLTFRHPSLTVPLYFSSDPTTRIADDPPTWVTVSRGLNFIYVPFKFSFPPEKEASPSKVSIQLSNVARDIVPVIRSVSTYPTVTMELIMASAPDVVEVSLPDLIMSDVAMTASTLSIGLTSDPLATEPYPGLTFTPGIFPGLQ